MSIIVYPINEKTVPEIKQPSRKAGPQRHLAQNAGLNAKGYYRVAYDQKLGGVDSA